MKTTILIASIIMATLPTLSIADEISITDTGITFDAPADFIKLSDDLISKKWPSNRAPAWAVSTETGSTTIAYDLKPNDISNAPFDQLLSTFETMFERVIPGIEWIDRKVIEIDDKEWIFLEMTSSAIDTDIHNIMLATSYGADMLVFNFNSTVEEFASYEAELRKSIDSIELP